MTITIPDSQDLRDEEPAVSWVLEKDDPPTLHFLPTFWTMVQTLAVMKKAGTPQDLMVEYLIDIVQVQTITKPEESPKVTLGWALKETPEGDAREAMLMFLDNSMLVIADLWGMSIDEAQDSIADEIIQTVCREHGPVGHA